MILSTVLASWGQLISLQNLGTFSTYGAHTQTGQFAIAALLVGGASVQKATNKQAIMGVILFHTLFIISPQAGQALFSSAQIGEYFRVFVAYGVIAVSLAMHAWKMVKKPKLEVSGNSLRPLRRLGQRKNKEKEGWKPPLFFLFALLFPLWYDSLIISSHKGENQ